MSEDDTPSATLNEMAAHIEGQRLDDVIVALREFEKNAVSAAFKAGFHAGWTAANKAVREAFNKSGHFSQVPSNISGVHVEARGVIKRKEDPTPKLHGGTTENVFSIVGMRPGLRGVEIVAALNEHGVPTLERTVRTVLWRLKNAGRIKVVGGRWYTPESAPPEPHSHEKEADNAAAS